MTLNENLSSYLIKHDIDISKYINIRKQIIKLHLFIRKNNILKTFI